MVRGSAGLSLTPLHLPDLATIRFETRVEGGQVLYTGTLTLADVHIGGNAVVLTGAQATLQRDESGYGLALTGSLRVRLPGNSLDVQNLLITVHSTGVWQASVDRARPGHRYRQAAIAQCPGGQRWPAC